MDRRDRAKQFMPFAAVTGLEEALRQKEQEVESEYGIIKQNVRYEPFEEETAEEGENQQNAGIQSLFGF